MLLLSEETAAIEKQKNRIAWDSSEQFLACKARKAGDARPENVWSKPPIPVNRHGHQAV